MSDFKLDIDLREALADIGKLKSDMEQLRGEMARVTAAGKDVFKGPATEAQVVAREIDKLQKDYNDIANASATLKRALKNAFDPEAVKKYTQAIAVADAALEAMEETASGVGVDLKKGFQDAQKGAAGAGGGISDLFGQFSKAALIGVAIDKVKDFAVEAVNLAENYKKTEIAFDSLLQGQAKAEDVIGQVNRFAAANGLLEENAQQAAKSLLAFGVPVNQLETKLKQVADISAGTGKEFTELATIFGKAKVAGTLYAEDINQLIDAGVPIIGEFAKILGVSTNEVKKLASEGKIGFSTLEQAFTNLTSEGGKFNDLAAKQAEITGTAARASSAWAETLRSVGNFLVPIKNALLELGGGILTAFNKLINPTKALNDAYASQFEQVVKLDAQVPGLIAKYEGLSAKQTLTKKEQDEMNETIEALTTLIPEAKTGVNDYGDALGVNLSKIKEFTAGQRELLRQVNKDKLGDTEQQIIQQERIIENLQKRISTKTDTIEVAKFGRVEQVELKLSGDDIVEDTKAIKAARQALLSLTVTKTELLRVNKQLDESQPVTLDPAAVAKQAELDAKAAAEAAKAAAKARAETNKAAFEAYQKAERERAQLRADLLKEGIERDIALENIRAQAQQEALRKAFAGRKELQSVLEQAEALHGRNLVDIQAKYALEKIQKAAEAAQAEREAVERGFAELVEAEKQGREAVAKVRGDNSTVQKQAADLQKETFEGSLLTLKEVFLEEQVSETKRIQFLKESQARRAEFLKTPRTEEEVATFDKEERGRKLAFLAKQTDDKKLAEYEKEVAKARELFQLAQQAAELQRSLDFNTELTATEKASLTQRRDNVLKEIEQLQAGIGDKTTAPETGGGFDFFKLIGANTDEEKDRIKQAASEIVGAIGSIAAAQVEAAQVARDAADERVSAAQDALDRELQLADIGFASNVTLRQKELADAEAARQVAIEQQKKAARQQLAIDAAQQVSSIITASARIFAEGAKFFPVGLVLAVAGVASLLATMASVRAKAKAISSGQFRHGGSGHVDKHGVIVGPSHEGGGVTVPEYEGGEFFTSDGKQFAVVNKKMTARHFELLRAVNADDRGKIITYAMKLANLPKIQHESFSQHTAPTYNNVSIAGDGFTKQERRQLLSLLSTWKGEQRTAETVSNGGTSTVIRQGTHTRKIRN